MDATTYAGTGATNNVLNQYGFKPDLVWIKNRGVNSHQLSDSVRGINLALASDLTLAEYAGNINAFNTNGFQVTTSSNAVNNTGNNYIGWQWQAGQGTTSSNTNGSITSTVSVNATAGFSIVTYTGTGSIATIGHGLGVAPAFMVIKARNAVQGWLVYHQSIGNTGFVYLNDTAVANYSINGWNNTSPTSTVFTSGVNGFTNQNGQTQVAYCWAEIDGFSKFGSYTGNGSTDGPFVYTGFRPKLVIIKVTSTTQSWTMEDTSRDPYNASGHTLWADLSSGEADNTSAYPIDLLSNGFKLRNTGNNQNANGATYIYAAFAENPFKYSLAR
jgi:hypothetical protein